MNVIIIGGGASGMMAGIVAASNGNKVTILEHKDKIGKKLLATGNGRCNLTNASLLNEPWKSYPLCDTNVIKEIFRQFSYEDTCDFFYDLGIILKDRNGLKYPLSDQASAVLDALRFKLYELSVNIICDCGVKDIKSPQGNKKEFEIQTDKGILRADRVILSTGSKAQPKLGSDGSGYELSKRLGHHVVNITPGLVQLRCKGEQYKALAGVRCQAKLYLYENDKTIYEEEGELQFTAYGISGIVTMNVSNYLAECDIKKSRIEADLLPGMPFEELKEELFKRAERFKEREAVFLLNGMLPRKLIEVLLKECGIKTGDIIGGIHKNTLCKLMEKIKNYSIEITGTNTFDEAQICLGGVDVKDIKPTMESKLVPGLYFCGEILNLHGNCGGFNLQLAWSTGAIAGRVM